MKINLSILAAFIMLFLTSCGGSVSEKDQVAAYLPSGAAFVIKVSPDVLMDKVDYESLKKLEFFKDGIEKAKKENEKLATILNDPASSGIDLKKSIFMVATVNGKEDVGGGIYFPLADRGQFENFLDQAEIPMVKSEIEGGTLYLDDKGAIVVRDDIAIIAFDEKNGYSGLVAKKDDNLTQNKNFKKFLKGKGDISYWMSSAPFMELMGSGDMMQTLKMFKEDDLKNNFSHAFVSFEDGAIDMDAKTYLSSGLKSDLSLIFGDGVSHDFSKDFPAENLQGIYTVSMSIKGAYQLTKEYFLNGLVENQIESQLGLTMKEITSAFSGEMAAAFYIKEGESVSLKKSDPEMLFALDIGKKKTYNKLMNNLVEKGMLTQDGNVYKMSGLMAGGGMTFLQKGDVLYVIMSKSDGLLARLSSGDFEKGTDLQKKIKKLSKNHLAGFIFQPSFLENMTGEDMPEIFSQFVSIEGAYGLSDGFGKVEFKDKSINSLKMLMNMANEAYKADKKKNEEMKEMFENLKVDGVEIPEEALEL